MRESGSIQVCLHELCLASAEFLVALICDQRVRDLTKRVLDCLLICRNRFIKARSRQRKVPFQTSACEERECDRWSKLPEPRRTTEQVRQGDRLISIQSGQCHLRKESSLCLTNVR